MINDNESSCDGNFSVRFPIFIHVNFLLPFDFGVRRNLVCPRLYVSFSVNQLGDVLVFWPHRPHSSCLVLLGPKILGVHVYHLI